MGTEKQRLLIMGLRRSGKSSILNVVFNKMSPDGTRFLEPTSMVSRNDILSFLNLQLWDFPGHIDLYDPSFDAMQVFQQCGALVFVIDAQDDYLEAIQRLCAVITRAFKVNPAISFEVFIHKVDGIADDYKIETQRDIYQRLIDELGDTGLDSVRLSFHLTSIYDHSVSEAFSKVIQKLIPQLPTLENLLNMLQSNTGIEKAFLFDMASKIYIATDSSPVDMQSYELCSDMIDTILDVTSIYSPQTTTPITTQPPLPQPPSSSQRQLAAMPSSSSSAQLTHSGATAAAVAAAAALNGNDLPEDISESFACIRLSNGMALYLRHVNQHLVLVSLLRDDNFDRQGLMDYNFRCIAAAIHQVLSKE
eukprot:jgi/Hompol1/2634/HPOL_001042-RA